jgi:hypothetical protein
VAPKVRAPFVRSQRFKSPDYFVSEAKGAADSILKYDFVASVIMVGIGEWPADNLLSNRVQRAYADMRLAFHAAHMARLALEVPDERLQLQFGDVPPIMLARNKRVE